MNALVVGHGHMGRIHAHVLRDLGYQVTTVDPDPYANANCATLEHALLTKRYHIAALATPVQHLLGAAYRLAGTPMLIEKPCATTAHTAQLLANRLRREHVTVGYIERFNPVVRELKRTLEPTTVAHAHFTRWSDRPSWNPTLDLMVHDLDLAHHLRIPTERCTYDVRTQQEAKQRTIHLQHHDSTTTTVDLMAHNQSPLHTLWHAHTTGQATPTLSDAVHALHAAETIALEELAA